MKDARSFTAGEWDLDRQAFVFQCNDPRRGNRWTFCVAGTTLRELERREPFVPWRVFHELRDGIYHAARDRMVEGDPTVQQTLSANDIRLGCDKARPGDDRHGAALGAQVNLERGSTTLSLPPRPRMAAVPGVPALRHQG